MWQPTLHIIPGTPKLDLVTSQCKIYGGSFKEWKPMEDKPIKLAELVDAMRRELNIARKQGEGNDFRFNWRGL